ncbi:MAG: NAD(P)-binding domain-containing protein [Verrucomicrobia bacterium]|nr:NAD(P)-binding domain-containing protein [Verrucomicrobiota bacterium]
MKIGIIGSGNMGRSLGIVWAELGHAVFFGGRDLQQARQAAALTQGKAQYGNNDDAALFGEILVYSLRDVPPSEALQRVDSLDHKVVIDLNNSEIPPDFEYGPIELSHAERLQQQIPRARVVKAYNTFPQEIIELFPDRIRQFKIAAFVAGEDQNARDVVLELSRELGLDPIDCGALKRARLIEGLADFIRLLLIGGGRPDANFSIVDVPDIENPRLGGRQPSKLK